VGGGRDLALRPVSGGELAVRAQARGPLTLGHVASANRRYPGEPVTFYTRVQAVGALTGFRVQISVPAGMTLNNFNAPANHGDTPPDVVFRDESRYVIWNVERRIAAGEVFEYETQATVRHTLVNLELESTALLMPGDRERLEETAVILVPAQGRYLQHMPRVYQEQDELMGRFLMLFESFWAPIEGQIDTMPYFFDPAFAPKELLPWLATWVDLALDDRWPEDKRRKLLRAAVALFRKRGTRRGLQEYLEIYTGARVQISEHGANNFTLGPNSRLGPGVALGTINMPHTFTVTVFLDTTALRNGADLAHDMDRARFETDRRKMIEAIIEVEKPAHTSYQLRFQAV
jgi:phage tail-like protein